MALDLCGFVGGNSGAVNCDKTRGLPKKLLVGGKVFAPADYLVPATFQAAIKAACKLSTGDPDKLFPFPEIGGTTPKTDANKEATQGYGFKQVTIEGRPAYEYQVAMGHTTFQQLRKFNRAIVPVFTIDDTNTDWGTVDSDRNFSGEMAQLFISGNGFQDGSAPGVATIAVSYLSASDFNDSSGYIPLNFNINEAKGLLTVTLSEYAVHASNVYHLQALIETARVDKSLNTVDENGDAMADVDNWLLTKADGTSVTITSVAKVAGKGWTFTIDSTAYSAAASGTQFFVSWIGPTALDAVDVTGVEVVDPLVLVKP